MTLSIAWLRTVGSVEELVFASDSRLRSGEAWDCCPKILTLPRSDCLISFAGSTAYAYPLMLQMARAIEFYPASSDRRVDIAHLKGHTLRVFNHENSPSCPARHRSNSNSPASVVIDTMTAPSELQPRLTRASHATPYAESHGWPGHRDQSA